MRLAFWLTVAGIGVFLAARAFCRIAGEADTAADMSQDWQLRHGDWQEYEDDDW